MNPKANYLTRYSNFLSSQQTNPSYFVCGCDIEIIDGGYLLKVGKDPVVNTHPNGRRQMLIEGISSVSQGGGTVLCDIEDGIKFFPVYQRHEAASHYRGFATITTSVAASYYLWFDHEAVKLWGVFGDLILLSENRHVKFEGKTDKENFIFDMIFRDQQAKLANLAKAGYLDVEVRGIVSGHVSDIDIGHKENVIIDSELNGNKEIIDFSSIVCYDNGKRDGADHRLVAPILDFLAVKRLKLPKGRVIPIDGEMLGKFPSRRKIGFYFANNKSFKFHSEKTDHMFWTNLAFQDGKEILEQGYKVHRITPVMQKMYEILFSQLDTLGLC